jgi:hypothetical protein
VVTTIGCPEDDNPLSYDRLDGEWLIWYEVAHRFERAPLIFYSGWHGPTGEIHLWLAGLLGLYQAHFL